MNGVWREDGHLTDGLLQSLSRGIAGKTEKLAVAGHIGQCDLCAQRFTEFLEQEELLELPPQFAGGVERKLCEVRVTATPLSLGKKERFDLGEGRPRRSREAEFRRYSRQVAIAACLALLLLFSGTFSAGLKAISKSQVLNPDLSRVNELTQGLSEFSQNLIHWEVNENDKKEK